MTFSAAAALSIPALEKTLSRDTQKQFPVLFMLATQLDRYAKMMDAQTLEALKTSALKKTEVMDTSRMSATDENKFTAQFVRAPEKLPEEFNEFSNLLNRHMIALDQQRQSLLEQSAAEKNDLLKREPIRNAAHIQELMLEISQTFTGILSQLPLEKATQPQKAASL